MDLAADWQSRKNLAFTSLFMMENKVATDICFIFDEEKSLEAHKFILMSRSTVFYAMFEGSMKTPEREIKIKDIEYEVFQEMLKFLYKDEIQISQEMVYQLLYAAEKYQILSLKDKCGEALAKTIESVEIALHLLDTADRYHVDNLYQPCTDYIGQNLLKENVSLVLDKAVFHDQKCLIDRVLAFLGTLELTALQYVHGHSISRETLSVLLESDDVRVQEVDVLKLCDSWATQACQKQGMDACTSAKRDMLGNLLYKIRFPTMTPVQFSTTVSPSGLLTLEEEVGVLRYLCGNKQPALAFPCRSRNAFVIEQVTPDKHITVKAGRSWRLVGFKLTGGEYLPVQINVNGRNVVNYNYLPQGSSAKSYIQSGLVSTLTFGSDSKVDIFVPSVKYNNHTTYTDRQLPASDKWSEDLIYIAPGPVTKLYGIIYQVEKK